MLTSFEKEFIYYKSLIEEEESGATKRSNDFNEIEFNLLTERILCSDSYSSDTSLGFLKDLIRISFKLNFKNIINQLNRIESHLDTSQMLANLNRATNTSNNECVSFEYTFFRLLKFIVIHCGHELTIYHLNALLYYGYLRCSHKLDLFQSLNLNGIHCQDYDEQDKQNSIELLDKFQSNILILLFKFKELHDKYELDDDDHQSFVYYDFMASLISIYLDVNLALSNFKINKNSMNLQEIFCLHVFYLLDTRIYFICNCLLQISCLNEQHIVILLSIVKKVIHFKLNEASTKHHPEGDRRKLYYQRRKRRNVSKSFYLRLVLVFRRFALYCGTQHRVMEKFQKFLVFNLKMPIDFKHFLKDELIMKHLSIDQTTHELRNTLSKFKTEKKLRDYLLNDLDAFSVKQFILALHHRTMKSTNDSGGGSSSRQSYSEIFFKGIKTESIDEFNQQQQSTSISIKKEEEIKEETTNQVIDNYQEVNNNESIIIEEYPMKKIQISKLNLFRDIYNEDDLSLSPPPLRHPQPPPPSPVQCKQQLLTEHRSITNNFYQNKEYANNNKGIFIRLDDLVSIRINEEYFRNDFC